MNNSERTIDRSEQTDNVEPLPPEGASWQNPGEFPNFRGEVMHLEADKNIKNNNREVARSLAQTLKCLFPLLEQWGNRLEISQKILI